MKNKLLAQRARRKKRVSSNMHGTAERPRVSVYRSNKYIYAQAIDDDAAKTLVSADSRTLKESKTTKSEVAALVGKSLAEKLTIQKVTIAIFDRGSYLYKGRVKALAEGIRAGGITV
ncbi:MAG: 50S ribosomal protein L18 [bacterium]|nr:50S ribosomal protein L18 [bacterium]